MLTMGIKQNKLYDAEKPFGVHMQKTTFNEMIMPTKEVIYREKQGNILPFIIHVKRILFNQMIKEGTSIMTGAQEQLSSFS